MIKICRFILKEFIVYYFCQHQQLKILSTPQISKSSVHIFKYYIFLALKIQPPEKHAYMIAIYCTDVSFKSLRCR